MLGASVPPELLARIRTITLDLPAVEGLPECAVSTAGVPPEKVELKKVFGRSPFAGIVAEVRPVVLPAGLPPVARRPGSRGRLTGSFCTSRRTSWFCQSPTNTG